jgi:DNA-binding transcriptional LysR family regulator
MPRERFVLRTDDQVACVRLAAAGAGIGFITRYCVGQSPGVQTLLPMRKIPALPCSLAVHRKSRGNAVGRRVHDFLAGAIPAELERLGSTDG